MSEKCPICGKKTKGVFGVAEPSEEMLKEARALGFSVPEGVCYNCTWASIEQEKHNSGEQEKAEINKLAEKMTILAQRVEISTFPPVSANFINKGIVSTQAAIGTGPIMTITSAFADAFGEESNAYGEKIRIGFGLCETRLKLRAIEAGGNSVAGLQVTYTELTSGHGMILVCMTGTAILDNAMPDISAVYMALKNKKESMLAIFAAK